MFKSISKFLKSICLALLSIVALSSCNGGEPKLEGFQVNLGKHELSLVINTSERLEFDFINRETNESDYPEDDTVSFVSSNPTVASVTSSGLIKGLAYGEATITITMLDGGSTDTCVVTVSDPVDYASQLKLDMNTSSKKAEVETYLHIDGDTTHFHIDKSYGYEPAEESGVLKARYLAVDTPESTGKIEEWGKAASNFTKERVTNAVSVIVESDDENWNVDSTGGRALVWVWYKPSASSDYRNLNLELLQNGLSKQKSTLNTRYGDICAKAFNQAKAMKLKIHSNEIDPDFYYGAYKRISIKELRTHAIFYKNTLISFDCTVARVMGQTIYVEDYDPNDDIVYGMQLYLGFSAPGEVSEMCSTGNRIQVAGSFQYYEAGGTYQVSDPAFSLFAADDDYDTYRLLKLAADVTDQNMVPQYKVLTIPELTSKKTLTITDYVEVDEGEYEDQIVDKQFALGELMTAATAQFNNVKIVNVVTTSYGDNKGAHTLTCKDSNNNSFTIRTEVLHKAGNQLVTSSDLLYKTINAKGIIDYYNGKYQLRVLNYNDLQFIS